MQSVLSREEVVDKLCRLAAERAGVSRAEVAEDTHLFNDLNFDSLDAVDFTMNIEDEFDVSIADEQAQEVKTIAQAADLLVPR